MYSIINLIDEYIWHYCKSIHRKYVSLSINDIRKTERRYIGFKHVNIVWKYSSQENLAHNQK